MKGPRSVQLSRGMTALIGLIAVGGSFYAGAIVDLLIQSYELSVYCLFIPVCAALFKSRGNSLSAWLAFALGGIGFGLTRYVSFDVPKELVCLLLSGTGYILGEAWMRWGAWSSGRESSALCD
jgi:solute:Na+ symporter, SSS family